MNLPVFLDIAIGLVFIYLILSIIASEIQEALATVLQWRAKHLKKSVESMLSGGSEPFSPSGEEIKKAEELVKELYNDPLLNTLNHEARERFELMFREMSRKFLDKQKIAERNTAPSYIPSETFAASLLQTLKFSNLVESIKQKREIYQIDLNSVLAAYQEIKAALNDNNLRIIRQKYGLIVDDPEFQKAVRHLPSSLLVSLSVLAQRAQIKVEHFNGQMEQFQQEIETWFDRSMERTSGVYKRNAKGIAIIIGIIISILTNTDTFHIVSRLSKDSAIRMAITESASRLPTLYNQPKVKQEVYQALEDFSLPVGLTRTNFQQQINWNGSSVENISFSILRILRMIVGWIVSGLAISTGAPFWFEVLSKFINIRNTGPKPVSYTKDRLPSD